MIVDANYVSMADQTQKWIPGRTIISISRWEQKDEKDDQQIRSCGMRRRGYTDP